MKPFLAIMRQTIRSATRSKVFHVLFVFILLAVFLLPVTVAGDGTATGLVQISLTYSLNVVVALVSTTTLWLSCSLLSREVENYNIHMVVSKPCRRWVLWLGKWCGVFVMHALILAAAAAVVYALIWWRVRHADFSPEEMARLRQETLVGRREYRPRREDIRAEVEAEYERRKHSLAEGHDPAAVRKDIARTIGTQKGEVKPGAVREWTFKGVHLDRRNDVLSLRYRIFSGSSSDTNQYRIPCEWGFRLPAEADKVADPFGMQPLTVPGGTFQEMAVKASQVIDVDDEGTVVVRFRNLPAEYWRLKEPPCVVLQYADGPVLLARISGFLSNYVRSMVLAVFQIAFLAALGTTVGALFSTPVAAFVAVSYLVIGLSVHAAVSAPLQNEDGTYQYKNMLERGAHCFARAVGAVVVSVDDLDATSDLARGRLVEYGRLGDAFLSLILLRSGLIALVGIWILDRRELGLVIKK